MATYAIGDIQGCYQPLLKLLDSFSFEVDNDGKCHSLDLSWAISAVKVLIASYRSAASLPTRRA